MGQAPPICSSYWVDDWPRQLASWLYPHINLHSKEAWLSSSQPYSRGSWFRVLVLSRWPFSWIIKKLRAECQGRPILVCLVRAYLVILSQAYRRAKLSLEGCQTFSTTVQYLSSLCSINLDERFDSVWCQHVSNHIGHSGQLISWTCNVRNAAVVVVVATPWSDIDLR